MVTLAIGAMASRKKTSTDAGIRLFAPVSGDINPVHLDEEYAATTRFGKRIAHGILTGSLISTILGNDLPGRGTIYLSQTFNFKATVELVKYKAEKRIATFRTTCANQDGALALEGEAVVLAPE